MPDLAPKLPASLEAIKNQAAQMLEMIDNQRAQVFVQQLTNGHGDDDDCGMVPGQPVTYGERLAQLNESEQRLLDGLPPAIVKQLRPVDALTGEKK